MHLIQVLAGFIQQQQAWLFYQGSGQEDHPLQAQRERKQRSAGEFEQRKALEPAVSSGTLRCRWRSENANGFVEPREYCVKAGECIIKMELELGGNPTDFLFELPKRLATAASFAEDLHFVAVGLGIVTGYET